MTPDDKDARIKELITDMDEAVEGMVARNKELYSRVTALEAALDDSTKERCRVVDINNALTAQVVELREALSETQNALESDIEDERHAQWLKNRDSVLAKTAESYATKVVVERGELEALWKDRERLDWLETRGRFTATRFHDRIHFDTSFNGDWKALNVPGDKYRATFDAAMAKKAASSPQP